MKKTLALSAITLLSGCAQIGEDVATLEFNNILKYESARAGVIEEFTKGSERTCNIVMTDLPVKDAYRVLRLRASISSSGFAQSHSEIDSFQISSLDLQRSDESVGTTLEFTVGGLKYVHDGVSMVLPFQNQEITKYPVDVVTVDGVPEPVYEDVVSGTTTIVFESKEGVLSFFDEESSIESIDPYEKDGFELYRVTKTEDSSFSTTNQTMHISVKTRHNKGGNVLIPSNLEQQVITDVTEYIVCID